MQRPNPEVYRRSFAVGCYEITGSVLSQQTRLHSGRRRWRIDPDDGKRKTIFRSETIPVAGKTAENTRHQRARPDRDEPDRSTALLGNLSYLSSGAYAAAGRVRQASGIDVLVFSGLTGWPPFRRPSRPRTQPGQTGPTARGRGLRALQGYVGRYPATRRPPHAVDTRTRRN